MTILDIQSQFAGFAENIPLRIFLCQGGKNVMELELYPEASSSVTLSDDPTHQKAVLNLRPVTVTHEEFPK